MSMDDLLKGLAVFSEGLQQYQTTQAVNQASEQMLALNQQQLDKQSMLQQTGQIQQQLAMNLGAAGADAAKINALTGEIGPSQGARFQADTNMDLQSNSQAFQGKEKQLDRQNAITLKQMELDAAKAKAGTKMGEKELKFIRDHQKDFDTQTKMSRDSLDKLQLAKSALQSDNPIADRSVVNFMVKASGDTGVITDSDRKMFGGSSAYAAQAKQFAENAQTGKFTKENRQFMTRLIDVYEKKQNETMLARRDMIAKRVMNQGSKAGYNLDENDVKEMIFPTPQAQVTAKEQESQQKQMKIQKLQAWLADPVSQQPEFASKRQAVMKAISNLQGQ